MEGFVSFTVRALGSGEEKGVSSGGRSEQGRRRAQQEREVEVPFGAVSQG